MSVPWSLCSLVILFVVPSGLAGVIPIPLVGAVFKSITVPPVLTADQAWTSTSRTTTQFSKRLGDEAEGDVRKGSFESNHFQSSSSREPTSRQETPPWYTRKDFQERTSGRSPVPETPLPRFTASTQEPPEVSEKKKPVPVDDGRNIADAPKLGCGDSNSKRDGRGECRQVL